MAGGKGGGQTTTSDIPEWAKEPTKRNLARAEAVQQIGYQPYMGPDLAAFNPTQQSAMQSQLDAAQAFGLSGPQTALADMPPPQEFAGGIRGYSAFPLATLFQQVMMTFLLSTIRQWSVLLEKSLVKGT
jgi:hypothetical protein